VTYTNDIKPLLAANCTSCHSGSNASGGVDLSSYAGVKARASVANSEIQGGKMPPTGPLSAANKQLFQSWVSQGTPN
jgi:hypothetical protein